MDGLFMMTLPGLVVLLVIVGAIEVALVRRRRLHGDETARPAVAEAGFDTLGLALAPSSKHKQEHDAFMQVKRDEDGDAAPPRSTVDLETGTARIVLPPQQ